MAKVSIVVPVYNAEKRLKTCLRSLIQQKETDLEIILVNDGSQDRSGEICDQFAKIDSRIRVVHQENQGSVAARKAGVRLCTGIYSCFCDADDVMPKNAISVMLEAVKQLSQNTVCVGKTNTIWNVIQFPPRFQSPCFQIAEPKVYDHKKFIDELYCSWFGITNLPVSLCGKLYSTSLLQDAMANAPSIVRFMGEDLSVTIGLMPKAENIVIIPDTVYSYRPGGGTSKYQPAMMDDWISLYHYKTESAKQYPMPQDIELLMDIELCNMTISFFLMCVRSGKLTDSEMLHLIDETLHRPEVKQAAGNTRIKAERHQNVPLVRNADAAEILSQLKERSKTNILKKVLRKVYFHFA